MLNYFASPTFVNVLLTSSQVPPPFDSTSVASSRHQFNSQCLILLCTAVVQVSSHANLVTNDSGILIFCLFGILSDITNVSSRQEEVDFIFSRFVSKNFSSTRLLLLLFLILQEFIVSLKLALALEVLSTSYVFSLMPKTSKVEQNQLDAKLAEVY